MKKKNLGNERDGTGDWVGANRLGGQERPLWGSDMWVQLWVESRAGLVDVQDPRAPGQPRRVQRPWGWNELDVMEARSEARVTGGNREGREEKKCVGDGVCSPHLVGDGQECGLCPRRSGKQDWDYLHGGSEPVVYFVLKVHLYLLMLAVLGLRRARASSGCGQWGLLFLVPGPLPAVASPCGGLSQRWLLPAVASPVAKHVL